MTTKPSPIFFTKPSEFRKWLEKNHDKASEIFVGFYKIKTGKVTITWSDAVDEALCFGWIDGIRRSIDEESYCNRFTPRKPKSNWSAINIKKVEELTKKGLMHPAGLAAFEKREKQRSGIYSYEKEPIKLAPEFEKKFKADKKAWKFFTSQAAYYQKQATNWVMSAKTETTKQTRLSKLINCSEKGEKY